jgi:hypothetical protein
MPIKRPPTSAEQKAKLSEAQLAYIANDQRWAEHRRKLAEAQRRPEQRARLSAATKVYIDTDLRWPEHRTRMMTAAVEATRLRLLPEEIDRILDLRRKGRTFEYLSEEFCISEKIIRRELQAIGIPTGRIKRRRATQSKGFWRCFD